MSFPSRRNRARLGVPCFIAIEEGVYAFAVAARAFA
jgi:hypothetical protein